MFLPLLKCDASARFFALGSLLALVPAVATQSSNRLLLFASLGVFGLLARWLTERRAGASWLPSSGLWRRAAAVAAVAAGITHLVLAPPTLAFQATAAQILGGPIRAATAALPADVAVAGQTLIAVNTPDYLMYLAYLPAYRQTEGQPVPRALRALSQGPTPVTVERIATQELRVAVPAGLYGGQLGWLFRSRQEPFQVGQQIDVSGMTAHVEAVDERGVPTVVRYCFAVPLEDASLRWVVWRQKRFEEIRPLALGEVLRLEPAEIRF